MELNPQFLNALASTEFEIGDYEIVISRAVVLWMMRIFILIFIPE